MTVDHQPSPSIESSLFEIGGIEILYILLLTFWIVYLYIVKDYGYWEERDVPHLPAVFPCGSLWETVFGTRYWGTSFQKVYMEFKNERFVGFINIRRPCLLLRDPDLIKLILKDDFENFTDHSWIETNPKDYMMKNLFNMKGQEWKDMRVKLAPAYTAAKMKMMFVLIKKSSDVLKEVLDKEIQKSNIVDVKQIVYRLSMDVFAACAFGLDIDSLSKKDSEFFHICKRPFILSFKSLLKMYIYNVFPVFTKFHCFDFLDPKIKCLLTGVIRSTVEYREMFNVNQCDFLDLLIKLKQNQNILEEGEKLEPSHPRRTGRKEELTIEDITAETFLFFSAGYETTSNTTLFCLYELACHSHIQDKVYSELFAVLEQHGGEISYQALQQMSYMEQVINETMRRYPVIPQVLRNCTKNFKIPKSSLEIEEGLRVVIPVYALHHDPQYFPDPYTFNPDRFSARNCQHRHPFVFLPFGAGPRMCIGFRFGMMKVKTALVSLIRHYHITLTPGTQIPLKFKGNSFTTLPARRLELVFTPRPHKT